MVSVYVSLNVSTGSEVSDSHDEHVWFIFKPDGYSLRSSLQVIEVIDGCSP